MGNAAINRGGGGGCGGGGGGGGCAIHMQLIELYKSTQKLAHAFITLTLNSKPFECFEFS